VKTSFRSASLPLHQAKSLHNSATPSCGKVARKKTTPLAQNIRTPNFEKPVIKRNVDKKYGSKVSALVFQPNRRFNVEDFERYLPRPEPARPWTPPPSATGGSISERAARYVATIPGAVSGQGGHDTTYHVACVLVEGFGLSVADALPIIFGWNATCQPPWSEGELLHKLRSADANAERRGYMLSDSVVAPTNGTKITRLVLAGTAR
jgi:hypothetical protein